MSMTFTRTLGRTHPLATTAGTSANEELSLPQPAVMRTFFGPWSAGIQGPMPGASPTIPTRFSLADGGNRVRILLPLLALFGHGAMSARSPLSGVKRKSDFGAVRTVFDPELTSAPFDHAERPRSSSPSAT